MGVRNFRNNQGESDDIIDIGVGSGAFLKEIKTFGSISGIDTSENAIKICNNVFNGMFKVSEANSLPFENDCFDVIISFSVFHYFPSLDYAENVVKEMIRVLRNNGSILIADINDSEKKEEYYSIRTSENINQNHKVKNISPAHMFYHKSFFENIALSMGLNINIVDNVDLDIPFYTQSNYRYSAIMKL